MGQLIFVAIVAVPAALVSVAILLFKWERRVMRLAAKASGCPVCSAALSERSIQVADELWQRHVAAIGAANPQVKLRMAPRVVDVVCEGCGARLRFDQKSRTLHAVTFVFAFETEDL